MGKIYKSITELVGHTPLVELGNYEKKHNLKARLLGKLEYFNPSGSIKDRAALNMIEEAEKAGLLKEGQTIVDNTSGNTGAEWKLDLENAYEFDITQTGDVKDRFVLKVKRHDTSVGVEDRVETAGYKVYVSGTTCLERRRWL